MNRKWLLAAVVFLLCFFRFSFHIQGSGIASGFVDPVSKISSQDEAVYSRIAINMAAGQGWLTPVFLGRYALFKPPLLYWLSGASVQLFGPSNFSLRLPSLLAGSALATIGFLWAAEWGLGSGLVVLLLLLSNPLLHTLSRLNITDALLGALVAGSAFILHRDPALESRRSQWLFAIATGAAIMTKAVAGSLIPAMLILFAFPPGGKLTAKTVLRVCGLGIGLAMVWHVYQLVVHPVWFWSEYVVDEHFRSALRPLSQTSQESQAQFYLKRWVLIDPVLLGAFLLSIPMLVRALWRRRDTDAWLLACWIAIQAAAVLAFSYRNVAYLLPLMAPSALVAGRYGFFARRWLLAVALLALVCNYGVRLANPSKPWGVDFPVNAQAPSAAALDRYAALHRPNDLIIISPDDEFYSTLLPVPRVRYAFLSDGRQLQRPAMDFHYLGITMTTEDFLAMDRVAPLYSKRLQEFGLSSAAPLATVIEFRTDEQARRLIQGSPACDFYVPTPLAQNEPARHTRMAGDNGRVFLLAK